jgi:pimeloyl-ACP methyl ester carboxylesterase
MKHRMVLSGPPQFLRLVSLLLLIAWAVSTHAAERASRSPKVGAVRSFDQVPIAYETRGEGRTALVFVHCWGCDREFWREQMDAFEDDYRVVSLDLGGHGGSGTNRTEWTLASLARDVQAVVEDLNLRRVVLVGHSMGGPVAVLAAARMPNRVLGIVGVETLHNVELTLSREEADEMAKEFTANFRTSMAQAVEAVFPYSTNQTARTWVITRSQDANPVPAIALLRDFPNLDLREALRAVKVPIRCINAAPRRPGSARTEVAINRKYANYDAVLMRGVGHYPHLERPAEFNEHLRAILRKTIR